MYKFIFQCPLFISCVGSHNTQSDYDGNNKTLTVKWEDSQGLRGGICTNPEKKLSPGFSWHPFMWKTWMLRQQQQMNCLCSHTSCYNLQTQIYNSVKGMNSSVGTWSHVCSGLCSVSHLRKKPGFKSLMKSHVGAISGKMSHRQMASIPSPFNKYSLKGNLQFCKKTNCAILTLLENNKPKQKKPKTQNIVKTSSYATLISENNFLLYGIPTIEIYD